MIVLFRFVNGVDHGWPLLKIYTVTLLNAKIAGIEFHYYPFLTALGTCQRIIKTFSVSFKIRQQVIA